MAKGRRSSFLAVLAAAVLVAGPGMALYAALPCNGGEPMACCGGPDGEGGSPPPCHCSLNPVVPTHVVVEAAAFGVVLDVAPAPLLVVPDAAPVAFLAAPVPMARAAPLFVLFVTFLN